MRKFVAIFFILISAGQGKVSGVKRLEWLDPYGRKPLLYKAWYQKNVAGKGMTIIKKIYELGRSSRQNVVDIVVNESIYPDISTEIATFSQDLVNAGYTVQVHTISGMSHIDLRNHLAGINGLEGAIFVGEVPVAWFETNGFGGWEEYPHDIYFCDLDGTYIDADGDGVYDNHTGNVAPEIWVGRIYARNLIWDNEIRLLKRYFHKNHLYRVDSLSLPQRALSFVDDDWSSWTTCGLDYIYSNVVVINNDYETTASNYRNQLVQGYEWIHLCAHSSPWGHTFKYPSYQYRGTVFNYEIFTLEPHAIFYNLFACSGTRFVEENYSAGWYIFQDPYGLLAVGSTKTGSMLYFDDFYAPIGQQDMCIGDGFKQWFTLWGETDWDWFYGMNILGDPTLKPLNQTVKRTISQKKESRHYITNWQTPEVIAPDPESDAFPRIVANTNGKIWVTWESGRSYSNGRSDIFGAYYDGAWSGAMSIGPHVYWDYAPAIGIDLQNRPVVVWQGYYEGQYELFYSVYSGSWSSRQLVTDGDPGYDIRPAMLRDNSNRLWVVWQSRRNINLNIYASYFNGSSWTSPQAVTSALNDDATPDMALDSLNRPWVVYESRAEDSSQIWGSYYTGSNWVASGPISGTQAHAYHPAVAVAGDGTVWVVWQSTDNGNPDIFAAYFDGSQWSTPVQVTTNTEGGLFPDLATDNSGIVWLVYQSKVDNDWDIYYSYYNNSNWVTPSPVATLSGGDLNPQITCSNTNELWVVWQSYSSGNWEIMVSHQTGFGIAEKREDIKKTGFSVAPVIFSNHLKISSEQPGEVINIYDARGSFIKRLQTDFCGMAEWTAGDCPAGIYFVTIREEDVIHTQKVLLIK